MRNDASCTVAAVLTSLMVLTPVRAGLRVTALGKRFEPDPMRTRIQQRQFNTGGTTSVRNNARPEWKTKGYYQRNRDLGQVFSVGDAPLTLDAIVLRTGPSDKAVLAGAPGSRVFVQFFEVTGTPTINDNGTPPGTKATHGFTENHRADDYITGLTFRTLRIVRGGVFPDIPPTSADDDRGKFQYMRWDLTGDDEMTFAAGHRYAFMVGLEEPGEARGFSLANRNNASHTGPPSFDDTYPGGFSIRREGDGTIPPVKKKPGSPPDPALLSQSLFEPGQARYALAPATDGYPDVDTYRDLEFYMEARPAARGPLTLASSDAKLLECFERAKARALSYVREGDPVGPWYEAALPGREAFCMRDVSHQALGAHALGLQRHTLNMLGKFAAGISESKDWCSYREINRHDQPAPADYRNDRAFWYNLPANFDVLDACYRMYLWSGERNYLDDPAFLRFYHHTVTDYVARWDLELDKLLTRQRFMNRERFARDDVYQSCRGIPSYHEGRPGVTRLGVDLPAFQTAAYRSYARLLEMLGDDETAATYHEKAAQVTVFIEHAFWDEGNGRFNELLLTDGRYVRGGGMEVYLLYNDALASRDTIQKTLLSVINTREINIEIASHYPLVLYRCGAPAEAYKRLLQLTDPQARGRDYPEVSFAVIGAVVAGLMGIEPSGNGEKVATLPHLAGPVEWAEIAHLPFRSNVIDVRHNGVDETLLHNRSGATVTWIARFHGPARRLFVDGQPARPTVGRDLAGNVVAATEVFVEPGATRTVRRAAAI